MVIVTGLLVGAAPVNGWPAGTRGLVGPNPTPYSSRISPAFAGRVL
jgi:hypothetical protein